MALFNALSLPDDNDALKHRLLQVATQFQQYFGQPSTGVTRAPGRVNLIGEHVDYQGYAVLPMAIDQSVYVAFNSIQDDRNQEGPKIIRLANVKPQYKAIYLCMDATEQKNMQKLDQEGAVWAKYVLCGVLGIQDTYPELFCGKKTELQMLVDGDIPAGYGLSSSSALVVAAALATFSARKQSGQEFLSRMELAELCRRAEQHVGTMGGGMDQAVACLAHRGAALHLDFSSVPAKSNLVKVPDAAVGVTFVVANCLVVAEKAVDAPSRYNKRVVECALAAKLIAKKAGIDDWRNITRLVDVQMTLCGTEERTRFDKLQQLALASCSLKEYSTTELEAEFGEPIAKLFIDSSLEAAMKAVVASASSFKLQQRALHVWGEAERVKQFQTICAFLTRQVQPRSDKEIEQPSYIRKQLECLGKVMLSSHLSCQMLYECSCPELDALVDAAMNAGALGARLTGAGWGGCIVALVQSAKVAGFMKDVQSNYYSKRSITSAEASGALFESAPAPGANIFTFEMNYIPS
ncbi:unnamed protein product [Peronospora belbahrii]|uniref:Galactokinase n=1 Tax=Peronospora belbahrii TaxID=622444 RepID=A0AAU9KQZ3_9STRA|nr:unnamed protein product [Peronospora belbahrii]CAH0514493.1 unnamed protein product [Peronospora belbahrii]